MKLRLAKLGFKNTTQPLGSTPWDTGLTLTPLAPTYPATADYMNYNLALRTRAAYLSQLTPLPTATQNPQVLWLNVAANSSALLSVEAKWPSTGGYLVTFFIKDLWPNSTAKPRVWQNGVGMVTPVANTPTGGDRWTILWNVEDPADLNDEIGLYPAASGLGFTCCCLTKVVVSKLWLE